YLAMQSVLDPPRVGPAVAPFVGFALAMVGLSGLLNTVAIWRLRIWNPRGEPIQQRERPEVEDEKRQHHGAPGPARPVWTNPILWREVRT
ncbi:hypothetical protein, partial [Salmonella sp. M162]|uniref:hypothetical protein n=1 Tax=Salmonella sp. M162 TaxID=3240289 RepID=UPI00352A9325